MNPTCAACMKPIVKGRNGKVTIVGTEAFHQACVINGGVVKSRARELERQVRTWRENAERAVSTSETVQNASRVLQAELERSNTYNLERARLAEARLREAKEIISIERADAEAARRDLERVRAELDLQRRRNTDLVEAAKAVVPNPSPSPDKEPEDETAIRFGLLEFQ